MIRVVTDGVRSRGQSRDITVTHDHRYREFARARLSMEDGHGDVFELYLDDHGNLRLQQLPRYNEAGGPRVLYNSTADERKAPDRFVIVDDPNAPGNVVIYDRTEFGFVGIPPKGFSSTEEAKAYLNVGEIEAHTTDACPSCYAVGHIGHHNHVSHCYECGHTWNW